MHNSQSIRLDRLEILIAEPNAWERRQVASMLRAFGAVDIRSARDADESMEIIETSPPDLAIISEGMAGETSRSLIQSIRTHKFRRVNQLPIVYLASILRRSDIEAIARLGAHEIVCRPFSTKTLIDRIYWTIMVPRPFVRTVSYYGPEPRTRFWESALALSQREPAPETHEADSELHFTEDDVVEL